MRWPLVFLLWCMLAVSAGAETLAIGEARQLGERLLASGQAGAARDLTQALLDRDPEDEAALLLLARSERALGAAGRSRQAARAAWRLAGTPEARYRAALVRAQVLSSSGARLPAQFWLRRAAELAPNDQARNRAIRDFRYVRGASPFSTRLTFGATPSSNINNGSRTGTMMLGVVPLALSGDAQALSGFEFTAGIATQYRHRVSRQTVLRFGAALDGTTYTLSREARAQAPATSGSDFSVVSGELRAGLTNGGEGGATHLDLALGERWYAGDPLSTFARATLARDFRAGRNGVRLQFQLEDEDRKDSAQRSSTTATGWVLWSRPMGGGRTLTLGLGARDTASDSAAISHQAGLARVLLGLGEIGPGIQTRLSVDLETRDYRGVLFAGEERRDHKARLGVTMVLSETDYLGFAPEIGLEFERNFSNFAIYDSEGLGLSIGLRSVF